MKPQNNTLSVIIKFGVLASVGLALSALILYIREPLMIHLFILVLGIIIFVLSLIIYIFYDQIDELQTKITTLDVYRISVNKRIDQLETDNTTTDKD
ncbi:PepSY domain-containing protein [Candidatus Xianfuyuplasma coldseepsis]|uniref:PepSY domain-containing protein n=1 Tax=Candidatus Xianfuyuplasma coldseepsis TaxID=2782163 RepID=A0A7L7KR07_9MOLU|nr:PepSY domain-containing protein [Xianfuyuplasma coldseepsis]QMS85005.1 PepSY domain-containing protein [Xianfuyuplasma coldseepsis]